jgi:hypothetical protein
MQRGTHARTRSNSVYDVVQQYNGKKGLHT